MTDQLRDTRIREALVGRIHASPTMAVLAVTGGGVACVVDLLSVGGASRTVLEVIVPYAPTALADLLGAPPAQSSAAATAAAMAQACLRRAQSLREDTDAVGPVVGVACTAALVSDRPKRGPHRGHVALSGPAATTVWTLTLDKGRRGRQGEDRVVSDVVLAALAVGCGFEHDSPCHVGGLGPGDTVVVDESR